MKKHLIIILLSSFCLVFGSSVQAQEGGKSDSINEIKKTLKQVRLTQIRLRQMQQQQKLYDYVRNFTNGIATVQ